MSKFDLTGLSARKIINLLPTNIANLLRASRRLIVNRRSASKVFGKIYSNNNWDGTESVSGPGSTLASTENIRHALPRLINDYNIKSILDIPCGDAYWIGKCLPKDINYTGGDIVSDLIEKNVIEKGEMGEFLVCNLVSDHLHKADLIFVRDCFIHLPNNMIEEAINNIKTSEAKYLLTTTYPGRADNIDIELGGFRPVDLTLEPFCFPDPKIIIKENEHKSGKCMGLWDVNDI